MIKKLAPVFMIGYFGLFVFATIVFSERWSASWKAPEQPIAFSHRIHVSRVGLECMFCHRYADKSPRAGVPSVERCMSCHEAVATDRAEIKKLTRYWEEKEPIPWNRVYSIEKRKYVYFTHKRHVKANIDCSACHGNVGVMSRVRRVRSLEMGWCVSCHDQKGASKDCLTCHK